MNILQVIPSLNTGGAEVLLVKMSILMKSMGCDVTIITFVAHDNYLTRLAYQHGIEVVVVSKKNCFINHVYSPYNIFFVANYIKKHNFDIIHAHLTPAQICMSLVRFFYKIDLPMLTTEHSTYNRRRRIYFKLFDYFLYSQFDKVVAISEGVKDALVLWMPRVLEKCTIIYNGIDLVEFDLTKTKHADLNGRNKLIIISVGRFCAQKGYDVLLHAFALTQGLELVLVGDGELRTNMENLAKELDICNRVHFLGNRENVPELLAKSDIYVQSSLWEGFGIAVLEAMAMGLPIITSDVSGVIDVVANAGVTFPVGDAKKLAEAMMRLALDKKLRDDLSKLAKERSKLFSLENTTKGYLDLYNDMLKK